jgi:hypothetical protein
VRMSDRLVVRVLVIYHHQDVAQLEHLLPGRAQIGMTCMSLGRGGGLGGRVGGYGNIIGGTFSSTRKRSRGSRA